jgi:hypothetical protein
MTVLGDFCKSLTYPNLVSAAIRFHNNRGVCLCTQQFAPVGLDVPTREDSI